ncbi:MAG: hypothetical protein FWG12_04735 [Holophagaceae bacterium]|nr:hypothetical protein [Holophagaceae bacterium]
MTIASASGNVFAFVWTADHVGIEIHASPLDGSELARRVCPRGHGLGLDGLFVLDTPVLGKPWRIKHWDPDGSPSFCSNGTRAAVALLPGEFQGTIDVCSNGELVLLDRKGLEVALRLPQGDGFCLKEPPDKLPFPAVFGWTGTPQLVLEVDDTNAIDLPTLAPPLRFHPDLHDGANVSFLQVLSPGNARIRTWERGVEGETLSCGQGAAIAAAWLTERSGVNTWKIQPRGDDPLFLNIGKIENRRWSELWLGGLVRVLGHQKL